MSLQRFSGPCPDVSASPILPLARPRTTPTVNDARNDTGRTAYCGPIVLSAITGFSVSKVEARIREFRGEPASAETVVGTYAGDVESALAAYGYRMHQIADFQHLERRERPSVWSWMQRPKNAWAYYILAIHKGREGHWILIRGAKMCDTFTDGRWTFVCDGPHRGAKVMEIFEVRRDVSHI